MQAERASSFLDCDAIRKHDQRCVSLETLKRKLGPSRRLNVVEIVDPYPSPPMSRSPSPPQQREEESSVTTSAELRQQSSTSSTTGITTTAHMPVIAAAAPSFVRPLYEPDSLAPLGGAPPPTDLQPSTRGGYGLQLSQAAAHFHSPAPSQTTLDTVRSSTSRGGRKLKAHVASACVNCKRAHLSCDVNRPCARCVASGKQDSCFDVQHKKRGRPRLREEGDFKVEQMIPESAMSAAVATDMSASSPRAIVTPRHRRTESYRSLRSQGSDSSGLAPSPTYPFAPPPTSTPSSFGLQPHPIPRTATGFEVPTAYLNMDLTFVKANGSYRQIMVNGQDIAGLRLDEVATAADGESFQTIRARLRSEREARDPAYMPPIHQPGQDPLQGVLESDVGRYTQGFEDRTYTWTQYHSGPSAQRFPARVRLAKANAYFVAVTLPSFRPVEQAPPPLFASMSPPPSVFGLQSQSPEIYRSPARQLATHSAPSPTGYALFPAIQAPSAPQSAAIGQQMGARTYPLSTYSLAPYQQQQPPIPPPPIQQLPPSGSSGTPRLPVAEPPTETTAFTPRTASREASQPGASPAELQLPPIITATTLGQAVGSLLPAIAGPSSTQTTETSSEQQEQPSDGEATPRKRRRMGIGDVLD